MLLIGIALAATLYRFNPSQYGFYPRCYLYTSTGLLCPGCGGLRATHQLLNGHLAEAFRLNPLAVLAAPVFVWGWLERIVFPEPRRPLARLLAHRWAFPILAGILAGYGIARNLPLPDSFHWLRP